MINFQNECFYIWLLRAQVNIHHILSCKAYIISKVLHKILRTYKPILAYTFIFSRSVYIDPIHLEIGHCHLYSRSMFVIFYFCRSLFLSGSYPPHSGTSPGELIDFHVIHYYTVFFKFRCLYDFVFSFPRFHQNN